MDTRLRANDDNDPRQSAQRSKTKGATMPKVKCAAVLKAKEVHNDAQGKCAEIPKAKCAKMPGTKRAKLDDRVNWRSRVPMQSTALIR
jgi:hypothetical protein